MIVAALAARGRIHPIGARRFVRLAKTRLQICRECIEELARRVGF